MSLLDYIMERFSPIYQAKVKRHQWLATVVLPIYQGKWSGGAGKILGVEYDGLMDPLPPLTIHPSIDPYLTFKERSDLLIKYGWAKPVMVNGKTYYYHAHRGKLRKVMHDWLPGQAFMAMLSDDMKVFNTGEDY